jgi:asparagine synthase (glutamine-hydrolysing)
MGRICCLIQVDEAVRAEASRGRHGIEVALEGEVINARTLSAELSREGRAPRSEDVEEIVRRGYEVWGDGIAGRLEGRFAFVLWDPDHQHLLAARSAEGWYPLYYASAGRRLGLATWCGDLLAVLGRSPEPEPLALAYALTLGYIPSPWVVWKGVRKLAPGQLLSWRPGQDLRTATAWEPPRATDPSIGGDGAAWRDRFERVLPDHLDPADRAGLLLSAGLDSVALAIALRRLGVAVHAVTIRHPDARRDESASARAIARHLGLEHEIVDVDAEPDEDATTAKLLAFDEPQTQRSLLLQCLLADAAAPAIPVAMAGYGAEEVVGGHGWYPAREGSWWPHVRVGRRLLRRFLGRATPAERRRALERKFARRSPLHRHALAIYPIFLPAEVEAMVATLGFRFRDSEALAPLRRHHVPGLPLKRSLQRIDMLTYSADCVLPRLHRSGVRSSMELILPFLDRRLLEWGIARPVDPREAVETKPVLRDYLRGEVPAWALDMPKRGFHFDPLGHVSDEAAKSRIGRGFWARSGHLSPTWESLVAPGTPRRRERIMALYMLTLWADALLTHRPRAVPDANVLRIAVGAGRSPAGVP